MPFLAALWTDPVTQTVVWSAATIGFYLLAKRLYRRWPFWWLSPLATAPLLVLAAVLLLHTGYPTYIRGTGWLLTLLGPATVGFAVPIYQQRAVIRRHWPVLLAGVVAGSATSMLSAWGMASLLHLPGAVRLSLLARSMSTPFAVVVSSDIGGSPDLTALFVIVTGVFGAALGEIMLARLPIRSTLTRGALLGMSAHGAGTAKAHEIGPQEGSIAGLVMVLVGVLNVFAAPLLAYCLHG
jgi:putative effector of murein hydrolase